MKKLFVLYVGIAFFLTALYAQEAPPQAFSFKALITKNGAAVVNKTVYLQISILQDNATGPSVYTETFVPTTNEYGQVDLEIGRGNVISGNLSTIEWSKDEYFLKIEYTLKLKDPYVILSTTQLLSVPYSLYSGEAGNGFAKEYTAGEIRPLFSPVWGGKVSIGPPPPNWPQVWARLHVGEGLTIHPGGNTWGSTLILDASLLSGGSSTEIYSLGGPAWEGAGKFLIRQGPNSTFVMDKNGKTGINNYNPAYSLDVSGDINFTGNLYKNGSSYGGGNNSQLVKDIDGDTQLTTELTPDDDHIRFYTNGIERLRISPNGNFETFGTKNSLYIGSGAGISSSGNDNVFIGDNAGFLNTTGSYNVAIGRNALYTNTTGAGNTATGNSSLQSNTSGLSNTATGNAALAANTTGNSNTATGSGALLSNTSGSDNTASGRNSLHANTTGYGNTATGTGSLTANTTGNMNTGTGFNALFSNTTGNENTAIGAATLVGNTTGSGNTATGNGALASNTTGLSNTANGASALGGNTTGGHNTATGVAALYLNTTGLWNTANGSFALHANSTGGYNSAFGKEALFANTTGESSTATGFRALYVNSSGDNNTAFGAYSLESNTVGWDNTAIGYLADVAANNLTNATVIGANARVNASNKIVLGNASATTVGGYGDWTNYSDSRLKENIRLRNELGLNFITQLRPVSFNYIGDKNKRRRDGLIAQDVEQILKELGVDFSGLIIDDDPDKTMNLSYPAFVIPLITAVQEQQKQIEDQQKQINELKELVKELMQ